MNSFNRDGRPTMHQAVCDRCGTNCEVPFRPSGDKPIFCNNCFDRKGGRDDRPRRPGGRRDFDGGRPTMHQAVCDRCGTNCEVPFRPSGDKPIFCNNCFDRKGGRDDRPRRMDNNQQLKEQLDNIEAKLDKILAGLTKPKPVQKTIKKMKKKKSKA